MIISALFRSGSTHFCYELANKLGLDFIDEIFDPLNDDILRMKRLNHEFRPVLKNLDSARNQDLRFKLKVWEDHSLFVVNNHSYDIPWFNAASIFFCRKDLLGSLQSMYELISKSKQPQENIWIYADWMRRFVEYCLIAKNGRPLVLAENCGYVFRSSQDTASEFVRSVYNKKISASLQSEFKGAADSSNFTMNDSISYARNAN